MHADKPREHTSPDEIDLVYLLERLTLFLRKYKFLFLIAISCGIVLGLTRYYSSGIAYKSRMIIHSNFLTNEEQIGIIDNWNELLKKGEYTTLAQFFNCPETLLRNVESIEGSEILKNYSASNPNGFYIDARIKDNGILPALQKAIVYGLNNTEYVKEKTEERKQRLRQLIKTVQEQIDKLDSSKTVIERIINSRERNGSLLLPDVAGMNKALIDMNEKLLNYEDDLKFIDSVQVLQSFIPLNTPVNASVKVMILMGIILGISLAFVIALVHSVVQRLNKTAISNDRKQ